MREVEPIECFACSLLAARWAELERAVYSIGARVAAASPADAVVRLNSHVMNSVDSKESRSKHVLLRNAASAGQPPAPIFSTDLISRMLFATAHR
jgi:hypothetical protein